MRKLTVDPKYTKTYKTVENMEKAVADLEKKMSMPKGIVYLQVEVDGRYTPVFTNLASSGNGMYIGILAHSGFKVVG